MNEVTRMAGAGAAMNEAKDIARLRKAIRVFIDSVERDLHEPDKLLCHVQTARRALDSRSGYGARP